VAQVPQDTRPVVAPKEAPDPAGTQKSGPEADEKATNAQDEAEGEGQWERLNSAWAHSMRYNKDNRQLQIVFKNGHLFETQADNDTAEGLKTSSSPGSYIWKHWPPKS
jgi:hypothetical protein